MYNGMILFSDPASIAAGGSAGVINDQGGGTLGLDSSTTTPGDAPASLILQSALESDSGAAPEIVAAATIQAQAGVVAMDPGNPPSDETWHVPSLSGGWSQASGMKAQYTLLPVGLVALAGRIIAGTVTAGTVVITLPFGYRPIGTISFQTRNVNTNGVVEWTLDNSGQIQIQSGAAAADVVDMTIVLPVGMTN